jgi:hypothetical protein
MAENQYTPHTVKNYQSIKLWFDLIVDEDINIDDPRIKSIIYVSNANNYTVITYTNPNAGNLAAKIAEILERVVMIF